MLLLPGQLMVTSRVPAGGKSTFVKLERPGRTLKLVPPRSVRTLWGAGVGVATWVGVDVLLPPQLEKDARTAPAMTARANGRLFIEQPPDECRERARNEDDLELRGEARRDVGAARVPRRRPDVEL